MCVAQKPFHFEKCFYRQNVDEYMRSRVNRKSSRVPDFDTC